MSKWFLPDVAPSREDILLASVVPNIRQPDQDAFPGSKLEAGKDYPELVEHVDYSILRQRNLVKFMAETSDTNLTAKISKLLSLSLKKSEKDTKWLGACEVRKYQLRDPKALFKDLVKRDSLREWLKEEIEDGVDAVYFVVGYYTVFDATTYGDVQQDSTVGIEAKVPIDDIVTHGATTLIPNMDALSVSGSAEHRGGRKHADVAHRPGERIYAFCYRKVSFSFFSLKDKEATARLRRDNCWALTSDNRGEDNGENDEGLEVDLGDDDDVEEDGFDMPDLDSLDAGSLQ